MKIRITDNMIQKGVARSRGSNPIALAMKEAGFKKPWADEVEYGGLDRNDKPRRMFLPSFVSAWIKTFNNGGDVLPTEFDCPARLGGQRPQGKKR